METPSSPQLSQKSSGMDLEKTDENSSTPQSEGNVLDSDQVSKPELAAVPGVVPGVEEDGDWIDGAKLISIIAALCLVLLLVLLDVSIIATAIPYITNDFHALQDIGWYGSAYQLATAAVQPLTGKIYLNFHTKWTFMVFFGLFELGSLICGVANTSKTLIVGRAVAGLGGSGLINGALTIIAGCVPMSRRPKIMGITIGFSNLGLVMGPLFGGLITQYSTWRWCFYINLPVGGVVAAILFFVHIPDQLQKPPLMSVLKTLPSTLDLVGFAIFAPAAIQLLLALQYGGVTYAWNSSQVIGLFCGSGATFIVFFIWEYHKGEDAMIPYSMARQKIVWSSCVVYGLGMAQLFTASYYLPLYFQSVKGKSPSMSGVYLLPSILSQITTVVLSGIILPKIGYIIPISATAAVVTAIGNGLVSTFSPETSIGKWVGYQILLGAGRGLGLQMPILAVQNNLVPNQIPVAMALVMFAQAFSGALFLTFAEVIFTQSLKSYIHKYAPDVNPEIVLSAGATKFRDFVSGVDLAGVLKAYSKSVDRVFYMGAAMTVVWFCFSWGMGWADMKPKKKKVSDA